MINIDTLDYMLRQVKYKPVAIVPDNRGSYTIYCEDHKGITQGTISKRISKINRTHDTKLLSTRFGVDSRGHYFVVREWEGLHDE